MKRLFFLLVLSTLACASIVPTTPAATVVVPVPTQSTISTALQPPPTQTVSIATQTQEVVMKFEITSPAFVNGASIPVKFSCKGQDITPELAWTEPPSGTQSLALIMDDPDAPGGTWVHWVIYNMPASLRGLQEGVPTDPQLSDGSVQGITSARSAGYHGPCPPSGTHHYFFKLYALDTLLSLPANAGKQALLAAMEGHLLANVELMGTFSH